MLFIPANFGCGLSNNYLNQNQKEKQRKIKICS